MPTVISTLKIKVVQSPDHSVRLVSPEVEGDSLPQPLLEALLQQLYATAQNYNYQHHTPQPQ